MSDDIVTEFLDTPVVESSTFSGSWLGCFFASQPVWILNIVGNENYQEMRVRADKDSDPFVYDFFSITHINESKKWLWSNFTLRCGNTDIELPGVWRWTSRLFVNTIQKSIINAIEKKAKEPANKISTIATDITNFLNQDLYLRSSDIEEFNVRLNAQSSHWVDSFLAISKHPYAKLASFSPTITKYLKLIEDIADPTSTLLKNRNVNFVKRELINYQDFFDGIQKTLTQEQRQAAVVFEDRNLLVAAAGSGKSSTLVGKIGYAIKRNLFKPEQIIALAFNRDAATELNQRINIRVKPWLEGKNIKAHTFHGLGLFIIKQVLRKNDKKIKIAFAKEEKPRLKAVLNECLTSDDFKMDWLTFLAFCKQADPGDDAFASKEEYEQYVERQRKSRRNGEPALYQSLSGAVVRSGEELAIANWLFMHGVPFVYEKSFSPIPEGWNKYEPDFYYPEINVWHEHFALNAQGEAPPHFGDYAPQAICKREWLTQHVPNKWFETQSHEYRSGSLFDHLKSYLLSHGQTFRRKSEEEVLETIRKIGQDDSLDLILRVLHLTKSNDITKAQFTQCVFALQDRYRGQCFSRVFWPLYEAYNQKLKDQNKIDFNDMIIGAAEYLEQGKFLSPYQFVSVDEFQDLSIGRARLVKALLKQHTKSVLFGVGDDWQAINGFSGSDLHFFMNFQAEFGATYEGHLSQTFRCAQGIANVSAAFIQKNTWQKTKNVISKFNPVLEGVIDLLPINDDDFLQREIDDILQSLHRQYSNDRIDSTLRTKPTIYLLSRYGLEKTKGMSEHWLETAKTQYDNLNLEFMTVHKSKGLEADYVFLVGLNSGWSMTFPSTFTNDPLVDMLLPNSDSYFFAEERRLFYVGLTRAKKKVFIFFRHAEPSPFVFELMDSAFKGTVTHKGAALPPMCNLCKKGFMMIKDGPYGEFLGCSRYSSAANGCKNKKKLTAVV